MIFLKIKAVQSKTSRLQLLDLPEYKAENNNARQYTNLLLGEETNAFHLMEDRIMNRIDIISTVNITNG